MISRMLKVFRLLAVTVILLCFPTFIHASVVINEIYPKYADPSWEWVELYNSGNQSESLNQWKIDHTAGDGKSFILNASSIVQPHGFLVLYGSQTALNFDMNGDTVRLFDANGTPVDRQSYPGTLGYNTAMGRTTDGGDGWVICSPDPYKATPGNPNNCPPAPTPTPSPTPANTPTSTPTPTKISPQVPTPTLTPSSYTFGSLLPSPTRTQVLGVVNNVAPTPAPAPATDMLQFRVSKTSAAFLLLGIAAGALALMLYLWLKRRREM